MLFRPQLWILYDPLLSRATGAYILKHSTMRLKDFSFNDTRCSAPGLHISCQRLQIEAVSTWFGCHYNIELPTMQMCILGHCGWDISCGLRWSRYFFARACFEVVNVFWCFCSPLRLSLGSFQAAPLLLAPLRRKLRDLWRNWRTNKWKPWTPIII